MTKPEIIAKIKKCLALSKSSNEHEAAAALRQARKLMEAHGISDTDVLAAEAEEHRAKSGANSRPSLWETQLASKIADAFACQLIFRGGWDGEWAFIGCGVSPEIAQYAFTVLRRQAKRAREEYIKAKLKRCKVAIKTRRADLFSEGWVRSVSGAIAAFSCTEQQTAAIEAYVDKNYPALRDVNTRSRNAGRGLRDHELDDYHSGHRSGKDARLHHGVSGAGQTLIGG